MALIFLALIGAVLVVAGVAAMSPPWALITAGVICMAAAYLVAEEGR